MLMSCVFTLDSVFLQVGSEPIRARQTCVFYSYIVFLVDVKETIYFLGNLCFFSIHVNCFMARDDSHGAKVISECILWVRGLVPL